MEHYELKIGGLYKIDEAVGWKHAVLDLNPNDAMCTPINIIHPGEIFMILDKDYWEPGDHSSFYEDHVCLQILQQELVGWIIVLPEDIKLVE